MQEPDSDSIHSTLIVDSPHTLAEHLVEDVGIVLGTIDADEHVSDRNRYNNAGHHVEAERGEYDAGQHRPAHTLEQPHEGHAQSHAWNDRHKQREEHSSRCGHGFTPTVSV